MQVKERLHSIHMRVEEHLHGVQMQVTERLHVTHMQVSEPLHSTHMQVEQRLLGALRSCGGHRWPFVRFAFCVHPLVCVPPCLWRPK